MKTLRVALVSLLVASSSMFAVSAKAADSTLTLSCVTFTWPEAIYRPLSGGNVSFNFSFKNGCTYDLLSANYKLVDKFGSIVANGELLTLKRALPQMRVRIGWIFVFLKVRNPLHCSLV